MNNITCPCGRTNLPPMPGSFSSSRVPVCHVTPKNVPCTEESLEWTETQRTIAREARTRTKRITFTSEETP